MDTEGYRASRFNWQYVTWGGGVRTTVSSVEYDSIVHVGMYCISRAITILIWSNHQKHPDFQVHGAH